MKYVHQILLIFLFTFLGEVLHYLIPLPIPASIYGMLLLFAALWLKVISVKDVSDAGGFLTANLAILFIPPLVNLIDYWDLIKGDILPMIVIVIISSLLVFAVSGWITQWFLRRRKGGKTDA